MTIRLVDAFDLPEWLGTEAVVWHSTVALETGPRVAGEICGPGGQVQALDLLAVDAAYPVVVCPEAERHEAHQAWQFGEVVLLDVDGRVAAAVPASMFDPNLACETLRRVARSVGADAAQFTVSLSL